MKKFTKELKNFIYQSYPEDLQKCLTWPKKSWKGKPKWEKNVLIHVFPKGN
jgi:hypothetical protein